LEISQTGRIRASTSYVAINDVANHERRHADKIQRCSRSQLDRDLVQIDSRLNVLLMKVAQGRIIQHFVNCNNGGRSLRPRLCACPIWFFVDFSGRLRR
jgi:hypothetical protein